MTVLLDTCALLCWTLEPSRLTPTAIEVLDRSQKHRLLLCSMSLWEAGWKHRLGRLDLGGEPAAYFQRVAGLPMEILPVDTATWLENVTLDWEHRDPVDRTIVAMAKIHGAEILTSDGRIRSFYARAIW